MECFAVFVVILIVAMWILASGMNRFSRRSKQRKLLHGLHRSFGGTYQPGGLLRQPALLLRYGQTDARVMLRKVRTEFAELNFVVTIAWPYPHVRGEIWPRRYADWLPARVRMWPPVHVGGEFGQRFEVLSDNAAETQELLTQGVQWQLQRLEHTASETPLHVEIREGKIVVQRPWPKFDQGLAAQFVQGSLELYDQCMLAKATGIEFLRADEAQTLENVICKICGEEIIDRMVVCRRCKTPHHQDCWEYNGACSIYGCRETKYVLPVKG